MGEMALMGLAGDTKIMWNPDDKDEVKAAKATWDRLVKGEGGKGGRRFLGFRVLKDGGKGEQITEFDPKAAKLVIAPPMAGGAPATVTCRAKLSEACYDGKSCEPIYGEDSMADDGTYDGSSVVCDPCYIAGGQPALYHGDDPSRQQVVAHVNQALGL